ncbi:hypothetical protein GCM10010946_18810 [Undibacterium squillarum]|uniref:Uncharacterized protein n=1 Tax=Undibacterium squillarum TaxID=1131567 RepID=A0ABQ2XYY3_9BURK|nr:hypothetical protein GCM10010946_18810 [Undibacterium squillarum]
MFTQFLQPSGKAIHRLYRDFSIVEAPSIQESEMDLIYIGYTLLFAAISCALIAGCHRLRGDK